MTLKDTSTSNERSATTNDAGQYAFPNVLPGAYEMRVEAKGFARALAPSVRVEIGVQATQNFALEVGSVDQSVVVESTAEAPLQTADASVGNVIRTDTLKKLPNLGRQAGQLLQLQPASTSTGEVAGSRNDQTSIVLDGVEVSDSVIGSAFRTVVPTPVESLEEFRVVVANPNATLGRGSGAQTVLVTKRGSNAWHGSAYEYFQNEALNANLWQLNRTGQQIPKFRDNRYGATVGGPVIKNRTFFFTHYEGRRQSTATSVTRVVPSDTLKQGILRFRDASGAIQSINPKDYDPRGLGANPNMLKLLSQYPSGNDPSAGVADGLNTVGLLFAVGTPIKDEFGLLRLDHKFNDKWSFDGQTRFSRTLQTSAAQVNLIDKSAGYNTPARNHTITGALNGTLTPSLFNRFQFSWLHDRLAFSPTRNPGFGIFNIDVAPGSAATTPFLNAPLDVDTQRNRFQYRTLNYYQYGDQLTWQKSKHTVQGGFTLRHINSVDYRDDKVVGSIAVPVADITSGRYNIVQASQRPGFILPADISRYNQFYSTLLGLVDQIPVLGVRDSNLKPLPVGTGLLTFSSLNTWEIYAQDTWKITPSLTFTYGLTYQWQTPPQERDKHQVVMTLASDTSTLVRPQDYLTQKFSAAAQGQIYNLDIAYLPLANAGRDTAFDIDRSNFSPRVALAWNPRKGSGISGKLLGDGKTVFRGGYSLIFDRTNTVGTIIVPTLGVGFAQTFSLLGPKNTAGQNYRVGVDGPIPLPVVTAAKSPIIPDKPFAETLSFSVDPGLKVPKSHVFNFTIQRELPGNMVLELAYVGRLGRNLFQNVNLNSIPYNFKDPKSGQTFAQAFDAVAGQLRNKIAPGAVTPQPWFENLIGAGQTVSNAASQTTAFVNGNIADMFLFNLDFLRAQPFNNLQALEIFFRTSLGRSNYHAGIATLTKRFGQGLTLTANYTVGQSLDQVGLNQNNVGNLSSFLNPNIDYGPSFFDRRHIFNSTFVYDLPFGKNKRFANGVNGLMDRLIGGWYVAGIYRAQSGLPLTVTQGSQVYGGSDIFGNNVGAILTGSRPSGGVNQNTGGSSNGVSIGTSGANASKLNFFSDPVAVFNSYRPIQLATDGRQGRGTLRGFGLWNLDFSLGKTFRITEKLSARLTADAQNIFNKRIFADPTLNLQTPSNFGVLTTQGNTPRQMQLGLRVDF